MRPASPRFSASLFVLLTALLATSGDALAAGTVARSGATLTIDTGTGTSDGILVQSTATELRFTVYRETTVAVGSSGCSLAAPIVVCPFATEIDRIRLVTRDAFDEVIVPEPSGALTTVPAVVDADLGQGGDLLEARTQPEPVLAAGGDGDDVLITGPGNDALAGGGGSDRLDGGRGRDEIAGGTGIDAVDYAQRSAPVAVSLDGQGNDGEPALEERDNVQPDVERVDGGPAADVIAGGAGADDLHGFDGDDRLSGGPSVDLLAGGAGDDEIRARDGLAERVGCGEGDDAAVVDEIDTTSGCEAVDRSPLLQPDRDVDGIDAPQDCNDTAPGIHPGAFDAPGDGIDQDCLGGDAVDADPDRDGFPTGQDCDDGDAAIRPGGIERPGNGVDEDCNGVAEPFAPFEARVRLGSLASRTGGFTLVTSLLVSGLGTDDKVTVRCERKRGCPFKVKRPKTPAGGGILSLAGPFDDVRLRTGARIVVRIVRSDRVGAATTFTMRDGKAPKRTLRCFRPGKRRAPC